MLLAFPGILPVILEPANDVINAGLTYETLSTTPLGTSSGGTSKTSGKSAFEFLIAESAGTGTSGQVLTTGGAGSYYWAAGGGGGSVQPGTTINSTSLSYSGDNIVTKYTSPTFTQTNQLRAYINGLRQFASEYTANSANKETTK